MRGTKNENLKLKADIVNSAKEVDNARKVMNENQDLKYFLFNIITSQIEKW